jgi:uncharacterized membrane protein YphA (DoxX/SURF4 family)
LRGQLETIEGELSAKRREILGPIDKIWLGYEQDIAELGGSAAPRRAALTLTRPDRWPWNRVLMDSQTIDVIIRYFDVAVGISLICGFMTRLSALAAAGFLCSIMASQWPGYPGAVPIWYQLVETLGLLVIAATGAGGRASFDRLLAPLWSLCFGKKKGTSS